MLGNYVPLCLSVSLCLFFLSFLPVAGVELASGVTIDSLLEGGDGEEQEEFDWQLLQGALVLLGAAGRCQRCFAVLEEVSICNAS